MKTAEKTNPTLQRMKREAKRLKPDVWVLQKMSDAPKLHPKMAAYLKQLGM